MKRALFGLKREPKGRVRRWAGLLAGLPLLAVLAAAAWSALRMVAEAEPAAPPTAESPVAAPPAGATLTPQPQAQATPAQVGPSCITSDCHTAIKSNQFTHGPLNLPSPADQCMPCHVPIAGRHEFEKEPAGRALCLVCHNAEAPKSVVHPPFGQDCSLCHNPHGGGNRYFVKGGLGAEGCFQCHSDVRQGLNVLHGPVAQGDCLACHTPHQSDHAKLLTDAPRELCLACHVDFQQQFEGSVSIHQPAQTDCTTCHGAHGGSTRALTKALGRDLCAECHGPFLTQMDQYKFPHRAMAQDKSCEACHQPHASKQERLLVANNEDLCLTCHNKAIQPASGPQIPNIAAQISNAQFLHGPLQQKNCIACHDAHGSDHPNILDKAFPASFYESYSDAAYDLCFECHDKKVVLNERGADSGFRNGDLNLHYLHVNREKGRSCRACHHEHAGNQPKHIRGEVPFGRWTMKVEYTKTDSGGGCTTGCHLPYKYDRVNPVQNQRAGQRP
jgi:predicted CXXCH cytochrome family protein